MNNSQEDDFGAVERITVMKDGKIHIPVNNVRPNAQGVIRLNQEAIEALTEVMNETGRSARYLASLIITEAVNNDLIVFDRKEDEI